MNRQFPKEALIILVPPEDPIRKPVLLRCFLNLPLSNRQAGSFLRLEA